MLSPSPEFFERIPTQPGVYLMKDRAGKVVYVGKANNLRTRVRQYFRPGGDSRFFVAAGLLGRVLADVETVVVDNEKEALLLENHLIKKHQPRFNINLRDDKQYLVLRIDPAKDFPRVEVVRNIKDDGARYFGPYHSATSCRETLRTLNRHFQLRTCTDHVLATRTRACLQYQIKRCPGPCVFPVPPESYAEQVEDVVMFLQGKSGELVARLRARMDQAAGGEQFEVAAQLRDSIAAIERTLSKQNVVQDQMVDQDVFGMWREADVVEVSVLFIRGGKLVGRRTIREREQEFPDSQVLGNAVQQYYATGTFVPDEVIVGHAVDDQDVIADWLSAGRRRKVRILVPRRGQRAQLVALADKNAAASAASRRRTDEEATEALDRLMKRLHLKRVPRRIECFDIAHIQGTSTVASMVVFTDGVADRSAYRKFKVKSVTNDDFAAMYEVLTRRFKRALAAQAKAAKGGDAAGADGAGGEAAGGEAGGGVDGGDAERAAAESAKVDRWPMPDLLVVDGGKGQLNQALAALRDLGIEITDSKGFDVVGLAKERDDSTGESHPDRVFLRNRKDPIRLLPNTKELFMLARIRDEAHRFANTFHRQTRTKATLRSALDDIPGIGAVRRRELLRHFGSVKAIRQASVDDLAAVSGMNRKAAEAVRQHLDAG